MRAMNETSQDALANQRADRRGRRRRPLHHNRLGVVVARPGCRRVADPRVRAVDGIVSVGTPLRHRRNAVPLSAVCVWPWGCQ